MIELIIVMACALCGGVLLALGVVDIADQVASRTERRRVERACKAASWDREQW